MSRISQNPFALKSSPPARNLADSTENKESRPILAPPTFVLTSSESSRSILRPSALSVQADKLKQQSATSKPDGDEKENNTENNGGESSAKPVLAPGSVFPSGGSNSSNASTAVTSSSRVAAVVPTSAVASGDVSGTTVDKQPEVEPESETTNGGTAGVAEVPKFQLGVDNSSVAATQSVTSSAPTTSFVFGQNIHERVVEDTSSNEASSSTVASCTAAAAPSSSAEKAPPPTFGTVNSNAVGSAAEARNEKGEGELQSGKGAEGENNEGGKQMLSPTSSSAKTLTESAEEYQQRIQAKRHFAEVAVVTGEENESNVLQMHCKLYAFDSASKAWQERGRGMLRLNDRQRDDLPDTLHSRLVMRTQGSLRVILNTKVWSEMIVERPALKSVRISAIDPQSHDVSVYLIQSTPKDAEQLFHALEWRVTSLRARSSNNTGISVSAGKDHCRTATASTSRRLNLVDECNTTSSSMFVGMADDSSSGGSFPESDASLGGATAASGGVAPSTTTGDSTVKLPLPHDSEAVAAAGVTTSSPPPTKRIRVNDGGNSENPRVNSAVADDGSVAPVSATTTNPNQGCQLLPTSAEENATVTSSTSPGAHPAV